MHAGNQPSNSIVQIAINCGKGVRVGFLQGLPQICEQCRIIFFTALKTHVTQADVLPLSQRLPDKALPLLLHVVAIKNRLNLLLGALRGQDIFPQQLLDSVFENRLLLFFTELSLLLLLELVTKSVLIFISHTFLF